MQMQTIQMTEENKGHLDEVEAITSLEAAQAKLIEVSKSMLETPFARRSAARIAEAVGAGLAAYRRGRTMPNLAGLSEEHRAILSAEASAEGESAAHVLAPAYRWLIESCGLGAADRAILTLFRAALPEEEDRQIDLAQGELRGITRVEGVTNPADLEEIAKIQARLRSNLGNVDFAERIAQAVDNLRTAVERQRRMRSASSAG